MLYAIIATDFPNSLENRLKVRPKHIARLEKLKEQNRLIIAGPHPIENADGEIQEGFSGSLVVAEFASLKEAQNWASDDPYFHSGAYESVIVKPFKMVLP